MPRRLKSLLFSSLITGMILAACAGTPACADPAGCLVLQEDEPMIIAAALPLTGEERIWGSAALESIQELAAEQALLSGHPIQIAKEDLNCAETNREAAITRLTGLEDLVVVISAPCPAQDAPFTKAVADAGIPQVIIPVDQRNPSSIVDALQDVFQAVSSSTQASSGGQVVLPRGAFSEALPRADQ